MSKSNVSLETHGNLKLKKSSVNTTASTETKIKARQVKNPKSTVNGVAGDTSATGDVGKSRTKGKVTGIRKNLIGVAETESSVTPKINSTGSLHKITKKLKKNSENTETDLSNVGFEHNSGLAEDPDAKQETKKITKMAKVKKVLKKKSVGESESSNQLVDSSSGKSVENGVANTKESSLKLKLKKKSTEKPSSESKPKKTRGTKTFKLMTKEFGINKDLWSGRIPSDKGLNTMFNFPPTVENVKADAQAYRSRIDLAGFSNDNISLDLAGRRLVVVAFRLAGKSSNARKVTEVVDIPTNVDLDTLHISRRSDGSLVIEELVPSLEQHIPA